jgi:hypothetical protein
MTFRAVGELERGDLIVIDGVRWRVSSAFAEGHTGHVDLGLFNDHESFNLNASADMRVQVLSADEL